MSVETSENAGYIVIIRPKDKRKYKAREQYEALGYGFAYPGELLRDCGAALFDDKQAAWKAIDEVKAKTDEWVSEWDFGVLSVHKASLP